VNGQRDGDDREDAHDQDHERTKGRLEEREPHAASSTIAGRAAATAAAPLADAARRRKGPPGRCPSRSEVSHQSPSDPSRKLPSWRQRARCYRIGAGRLAEEFGDGD
jgi:hypothetical protein